MIRRRTLAATLGVVAVAVIALAGCGGGKLDVSKGEQEIKKDLQDPKIGLTVTAVTCPGDVPMQKDLTFVCKASIKDGDDVDIKVIQQDDQGNVTIDYKASMYVPDTANIASNLTGATNLTCPAAVKLDNGKGTLLCTATDDLGGAIKVNIPIVDSKLQPDQIASAPA